jgi:hypothetical protein
MLRPWIEISHLHSARCIDWNRFASVNTMCFILWHCGTRSERCPWSDILLSLCITFVRSKAKLFSSCRCTWIRPSCLLCVTGFSEALSRGPPIMYRKFSILNVSFSIRRYRHLRFDSVSREPSSRFVRLTFECFFNILNWFTFSVADG